MTKSFIIDPTEVRAAGWVEFPEVSINQYVLDLSTELERYDAEGMVNALHNMVVVCTFEPMPDSIKKAGERQDIVHDHKGPTHLGTGQEFAYVDQAMVPAPEDFVLGSHRSHDEILTRCHSVMCQIPADQLEEIMRSLLSGGTLPLAGEISYANTTELTESFVLFDVLAEIFARKPGLNCGLGSPTRTFFLPSGSHPNNAIVSGSAPAADGAALFKRISREPSIVVSNIGDAALVCGPTRGTMNFASMDQFHTLRYEEDGGYPLILFNFFNNFCDMGGQTYGKTMGYDVLTRVEVAPNPETMHAEHIGSINPFTVTDAASRKRVIPEQGRGPVPMDMIIYHFSEHSPLDASSCRTKNEVELWENVDCIREYSQLLISNGLTAQDDISAHAEGLAEKLTKVLQLVIDEDNCPRIADDYIDTVMFSSTPTGKMEEGEAEIGLEANPCVAVIARKVRTAKDKNGKPISKMKMYQFHDGLFEAMLHRFKEDPTIAAWGEENRD